MGTAWRMTENSPPRFLHLPTLCAGWCTVWCCHAGEGLDWFSCLADTFELVVITYSISEHIAPNLLWHVSLCLSELHEQDSFSVTAQVSRDFTCCSLHPEFLLRDDDWCHSIDFPLEEFCTDVFSGFVLDTYHFWRPPCANFLLVSFSDDSHNRQCAKPYCSAQFTCRDAAVIPHQRA